MHSTVIMIHVFIAGFEVAYMQTMPLTWPREISSAFVDLPEEAPPEGPRRSSRPCSMHIVGLKCSCVLSYPHRLHICVFHGPDIILLRNARCVGLARSAQVIEHWVISWYAALDPLYNQERICSAWASHMACHCTSLHLVALRTLQTRNMQEQYIHSTDSHKRT